MATKCLFCNIVNHPKKYLTWIFDDSDIALTGVYNRDIVSIYKKHGELPGGKNLNQMIDTILKLKTPWEDIKYEDHDHYRIRVDCKSRKWA